MHLGVTGILERGHQEFAFDKTNIGVLDRNIAVLQSLVKIQVRS